MTSGKSWMVCLVALCSIYAQRNATKPASLLSPLWSTDVLPPEARDIGRNPPGLAFLGNTELIVYYVRNDTSQLSSRESPDVSSPFRLRVSVVDTGSGKIVDTKEWGTHPSGSSAQVTSGGIIVRAGDNLRLYSKDFKQVDEMPLSSDPNEGLNVQVSTSGKTVLLNHYHFIRRENRESSRIEVLDGDTLKQRFSWAEPLPLWDKDAITDSIIATEPFKNGTRTVIAKAFGGALWNSLYEISRGACVPGAGSAVFASETLLVCADSEFVISSTKGEALMTDRFAKGEGNSVGITVARNGSRVAVEIENFSDIWDTGGRIVSFRVAVYDLAERKRIMTVPVAPPPKRDCAIALSPDGSRLAILRDQTLFLYPVAEQR